MNAVTLTKPIIAFLLSVMPGGHPAGPAEVKYIPVSENQGVFHVAYNNAAGDRFVLEILDQDGDVLFQHTFTDKEFSRNFQLADQDSYPRLVFVFRNLGDHSSQRFEVETASHEVEDVVVREIK
ncbi:MAG TPA: hypothetical protein VL978_09185 [Puia sp.]|nr:hypothetical protein [Puia sp.]